MKVSALDSIETAVYLSRLGYELVGICGAWLKYDVREKSEKFWFHIDDDKCTGCLRPGVGREAGTNTNSTTLS